MKGSDKHIIRKLIIDLSMNGEKKAFAVQQEFGEVMRTQVNNSLDRLLTSISGNGDHIRIDKLDINLGDIDLMHLREEVPEMIVSALNKKIRDQMQGGEYKAKNPPASEEEQGETFNIRPVQRLEHTEARVELLIFYMIHGYYPWWGGDVSTQELGRELSDLLSGKWVGTDLALSKQQTWLESITNNLSTYPQARERFVYQFDDRLYRSFIAHLAPTQSQNILDIERMFGKVLQYMLQNDAEVFISSGGRLEKIIRCQAIHALLQGKKTSRKGIDFMKDFLTSMVGRVAGQIHQLTRNELLEALINEESFDLKNEMPVARHQAIFRALEEIGTTNADTNLEEKIQSVHTEEDIQKHPKKEDTHFIENAGLVLVASFLPRLYWNLELLENYHFIDDHALRKAIHLSQFLVTGQQHPEERHLVLNKMLCGVSPDFPVFKDWELTERDEDACHELLMAVIMHWSILKNTTPEGLRENFLQREGILNWTESVWKLQIERKTRDVVLNYIPWTYQMVKLPWMSSILNVEW